MEIKSAKKYAQELLDHQKSYRWPLANYNKQLPLLEKMKLRFCHTVSIFAGYEGHDLLSNKLWDMIGPRYGPCADHFMMDHISCPVLLDMNFKWFDDNGDENDEPDIPQHSHDGVWSSVWMMKTGYDSGYEVYCFLNESDKQRFINLIKEI